VQTAALPGRPSFFGFYAGFGFQPPCLELERIRLLHSLVIGSGPGNSSFGFASPGFPRGRAIPCFWLQRIISFRLWRTILLFSRANAPFHPVLCQTKSPLILLLKEGGLPAHPPCCRASFFAGIRGMRFYPLARLPVPERRGSILFRGRGFFHCGKWMEVSLFFGSWRWG
jgi:hypothetical protein